MVIAKSQEEGFDLSASEKFGTVTKVRNYSQPLIELNEPENQLDLKLSYRLTLDGYIQIIADCPNFNSWIVAQQKRTSIELLSQLKELTRIIIMKCSNDSFGTYFTYGNSQLITKRCFDSMQYYSYLELFDKLSIEIESFKIIKTLRKNGLNPVPNLAHSNHWIADCPNCGNYLTIIHDLDSWECETCEFEGSSKDIETLVLRANIQRRIEEIETILGGYRKKISTRRLDFICYLINLTKDLYKDFTIKLKGVQGLLKK